MARYLVVLNLSNLAKQDVKIFLTNPEAEFLHMGIGRDVFARPIRHAFQSGV